MAVSSTLIGGAYEPLKTKNLNDKEVINMLDTTKIYHSKHSGDFKILKYTNSAFVLIEFIDTKYQAIVTAGNIRLGKVRDHVLGMSEEAAAIKLRAKQVAAIAAVEALKPTPEEIEEIIEQVMPVEESHPDFWALETSAHIVQFFQARKSYCRVHSGLARV